MLFARRKIHAFNTHLNFTNGCIFIYNINVLFGIFIRNRYTGAAKKNQIANVRLSYEFYSQTQNDNNMSYSNITHVIIQPSSS